MKPVTLQNLLLLGVDELQLLPLGVSITPNHQKLVGLRQESGVAW